MPDKERNAVFPVFGGNEMKEPLLEYRPTSQPFLENGHCFALIVYCER